MNEKTKEHEDWRKACEIAADVLDEHADMALGLGGRDPLLTWEAVKRIAAKLRRLELPEGSRQPPVGPRAGGERRKAGPISDRDAWDDAARAAYRDAYGHARAIVDAAGSDKLAGYWKGRRIPVERVAMIAAIAEKMLLGDEVGNRSVHPQAIPAAVDDVLAGRGPAY